MRTWLNDWKVFRNDAQYPRSPATVQKHMDNFDGNKASLKNALEGWKDNNCDDPDNKPPGFRDIMFHLAEYRARPEWDLPYREAALALAGGAIISFIVPRWRIIGVPPCLTAGVPVPVCR